MQHNVVKKSENDISLNKKEENTHPIWLNNFINVYQRLSTNNLDLLSSIYHPNVTFIDPMHQVEGIDDLHGYFERLYHNLSACEFTIEKVILEGNEAAIYWQMSYLHPNLNKGKEVVVVGNSHIKGHDDKVIYHRDFLDLGAMLYEQLPVFGKLTKWVKSKAAH